MNAEKISERRRKVENIHHVTITDDFGNVLQVGDHVDIYVWPFDYHIRGVLQFDSEKCSFVIKSNISVHDMSHYSKDNDGKAIINIFKYFRKITEGENNE